MGKFISIGGNSYTRPVLQKKRDIIRGDCQNLSPSQQRFFQNSREELRKELNQEAKERDEQLDVIAKEISARLKIGKQATETKEPTAEATEPAKESVDDNDKLFKAIAETLVEHRKEIDELRQAIETLADAIPEDTRVAKWREGDFALRNTNELSEVEKDQIERKAENIGLNGEVRRIRPYQVVGGRLVE